MRWVFSLPVVLLMVVESSGGLIIDNFTTPQTDPPSGLRSAVSGAGILGTERDIILDDAAGTVTIGGGSVVFTTSPFDGLTLEWDGVQGGDGWPDAARDLPVTDFTQGGANDRFVVDITSISGEWSVGVAVTSGPSQHSSVTKFGITSTGELEFLFSKFNASALANSNGIALTLGPRPGADAITIGAFEAVPEPSSWVLMATAGLAAIFILRGRKR